MCKKFKIQIILKKIDFMCTFYYFKISNVIYFDINIYNKNKIILLNKNQHYFIAHFGKFNGKYILHKKIMETICIKIMTLSFTTYMYIFFLIGVFRPTYYEQGL